MSIQGLSKVLAPLPDTYYEGKEKEGDALSFFESHLPPSDRREAAAELKKTLVLSRQKAKRTRKSPKNLRRSKKYLSSRERRRLGLYRLPKTGLKYESFQPLHQLWQGYMSELLNLDASGFVPRVEDSMTEQMQIRLCRADYHGAELQVQQALCPSHVGVSGLMALETRHTFQIISKDDKLRLIPKQGSVFSFQLAGYRFTIPGSSLDSRPADRATKKLKAKLPMDF